MNCDGSQKTFSGELDEFSYLQQSLPLDPHYIMGLIADIAVCHCHLILRVHLSSSVCYQVKGNT